MIPSPTERSKLLLASLRTQQWDKVRALIGKGQALDMDVFVHQDSSPLASVANRPEPESVACALLMVALYPTMVDLVDSQGRTVLMAAAAGGHPEVVSAVLAVSTLDPNRVSKKDQPHSALMVAAAHGRLATVDVLMPVSNVTLAPKHRVAKCDFMLFDALTLAMINRHPEVALRLIPHSDVHQGRYGGRSMLESSVFLGQRPVFEALLLAGGPRWVKPRDNSPPSRTGFVADSDQVYGALEGLLHTFSQIPDDSTKMPDHERLPWAQRLTDLEDPLRRNARGHTPLMEAAIHGHVQSFEALAHVSGDLEHHRHVGGASLLTQLLEDLDTLDPEAHETFGRWAIADRLTLRMAPEEVSRIVGGYDHRFDMKACLPRWCREVEARALQSVAKIHRVEAQERPRPRL